MVNYTTKEGVNYNVYNADEITQKIIADSVANSDYYDTAVVYAREQIKNAEKQRKAYAILNKQKTPQNIARAKATQNKRTAYLSSIAMGFDIETSTIRDYDDSGNLQDARSYMYHWQFAVNNIIIVGRTWSQFNIFMILLYKVIINELKAALKRHGKRWGTKQHPKCIIWVANLPFEFQYIKDVIPWDTVFAKDNRKPLTAEISTEHLTGVEKQAYPIITFQDCLQITNTNLATLAKDYTTTQKRVDDLDYDKIRNSKTPLDNTELTYCYDDVAILSEWHKYYYGYYSQKGFAPMTATGILRHEVKKLQTVDDLVNVYKMFPDELEYKYVMDWCFKGGYSHANLANVNRELDDCVYSWDITSSYPYVMLHNIFPMSKFTDNAVVMDKLNSIDNATDLYDYIQSMQGKIMFYAEIEMETPESITRNTYISLSKCINRSEIESYNDVYADDGFPVTLIDNGRILRTVRTVTVETDLDILTILDMYSYSKIIFKKVMTCMILDRLPDYVIKPLENAYREKSTLKKQGKSNTVEYKVSKGKINAGYGMMCTRRYIYDIIYDTDLREWRTEPRKDTSLEQLFLNPMWGVWVTAYARRRLMQMVIAAGDNTVVCDTDSIYCKRTSDFDEIINAENVRVLAQNKARFNDVLFDDLGTWDRQSVNDKGDFVAYERFATMGAKRYMLYGYNDKKYGWKQTVAGLPKGIIARYCDVYNNAVDKSVIDKTGVYKNAPTIDPIDVFLGVKGFELDSENSGKRTTLYHDTPHSETVTDYLGNSEIMCEKSSVSIVNIPFTMTIANTFVECIKWIVREQMNPKKEIRKL